jgi:UDP-glucose 4-epimerase
MSLYLVTGGAGFIGSALVHELVRRGERVRVYDNLITGHRNNLETVDGPFEFIEVDLNDRARLEAALEGVDFVLHQAAIPSVPRSVADPIASHEANATGTLNLLWAAHRAKVRRVVYAASSSAYGDTPALPKVETMPPNPLSPYAVNKLMGEYYGRVFTQVYGLETVSLRYFNIFGPRQDPNSPYSGVLSRFITALLEGRPVTIYGDGEQSRDFTYVANAVSANLLACTAPKAPGQVINIGVGQRTTLNQTLAALGRIMGVEPMAEHQPPRAGDVRDSLADIRLAAGCLGYQPVVGFDEGLRLTVEWYRQSRALAAR